MPFINNVRSIYAKRSCVWLSIQSEVVQTLERNKLRLVYSTFVNIV